MKILSFLCAAISVFALHATDELWVAHAETPIKADGKIEEYVYVGYDWSSPFVVFDRENAVTNGLFEPVGRPFSTLKTQCGVFTDEMNLYATVLAPCADCHQPGADDGVGIAVSTDGRTLFVAECDLSGKCSAWRIGEDGVRKPCNSRNLQAGVRSRKGAFYVELAMPYSVIGRHPENSGSTWRCNIYRMGESCGGISSLSPVQGDMFNTERFAEIVFGKTKVNKEPLPENKGKSVFVWEGERWSGKEVAPPPLENKELNKVSMFAPKGGRAVSHFRVSNLTDRPALYSLSLPDYRKNEFAKRVRFREVAMVELKGGPSIPDPIFDLPNGSVLRIPAKSTAMVWVDVDTRGMKPGVHSTTVKFIPGYSKYEEKSVALELFVGKANVRDVDMPCWAYPLRAASDLRALRDYMFNVSCVLQPWFAPNPGPDGKRDWSKFDEVVEAMLANGLRTNEVRILVYTLFPKWQDPRKWNGSKEKAFIDSMRAGIAYAKERYGIGLDRIWFSTVDEPHGDPDDPKSPASYAFYGAHLAKRINPGLKSWTNPYKPSEMQYLERYLKEFEVLVPFLPAVNKDNPYSSDKYAKSGKDIWSYSIYLKQNLPVQYRGISWRNFAYGFEGPATFYDLFEMAGDGFSSYDKGGAADYGATYRDRRTGCVTPSLRLEAWYQGHLEQRLLKWCRSRIDSMRDKAKAKSFASRLGDLVKRATAPRANFDKLALELLRISDEIAK